MISACVRQTTARDAQMDSSAPPIASRYLKRISWPMNGKTIEKKLKTTSESVRDQQEAQRTVLGVLPERADA